MNNVTVYAVLNQALVNAGMDPAKAMQHPASVSEFNRLCQEVGVSPAAICEAAGL